MAAFSFSIRVDAPRNVVYLRQSGRASGAELARLREEYRAALARLQPGFQLVNDQRELEPYDDDAVEVAKELVELTNQHGARRVIRIVADSLTSRARVSRILISAHHRYENLKVATLEEAEALLSQPSPAPARR